ncbi:MAG: insulinase family protein, partial [Lachnospiraceae bacterium]|nr:insulinase family protein [Lachnospiraceae bacterium]
HTLSAYRAGSYFSEEMKRLDAISGIAYYEYIKDFAEHFDERIAPFIHTCERFAAQLFDKERLLLWATCEKDQLSDVSEKLSEMVMKLDAKNADAASFKAEELSLPEVLGKTHQNEGIGTASQVQYASLAGNFKQGGFAYHGALRVLRVILNYDYFWLNIRVKGGAYGCMSNMSRNGNVLFSSFRDPNLSETYEVFEHTPEYLANFDVSDRDMTKYVIGTISTMDTPLTPSQDGIRALTSYLTETTEAQLQKDRDQVLACSQQDIRQLSEAIAYVLGEKHRCAIGNEEVITSEHELFDEVRSL